MEILRFYKEISGKWYADIPEWTGRKSALQMVAGADTLLEYLTENSDTYVKDVHVYFSEEPIEGGDCLVKTRNCIFNGAYYKIEELEGVEINLKLWLCDVTNFVFGYFPNKIYVAKVEY
jgi:hypothetical protein